MYFLSKTVANTSTGLQRTRVIHYSLLDVFAHPCTFVNTLTLVFAALQLKWDKMEPPQNPF